MTRAWKCRKVFSGPRFCFALILVAAFAASRASAQSIDEAKQPFVTGLIQVLDGISGTFGDERARVSAALDVMDAGLRGWDAAVQAYAGGVAARIESADPASAATMHVALGAVYLDRGRAADAVQEFTRAAALDPTRPDARRLRALTRESEGDAPAAAADFLAAWLLDPQDPAGAYLHLFHRPAGPASRTEADAVALLTAFAQRQPDSAGPAAPFLRLSLLDEAPASEPAFLPARYANAARQLRQRHFQPALEALRDAWAGDPLKADPAAGSIPLRAGSLALRDGRWPDAIARFTDTARDFPSSSEARRLLGTAYWLNDESARGMEQLRLAIATSPRDERSRIALADVLIGDRQFADAERLLTETTAMMPASGQAHWRLARVLDALHRDAEARRERESAVALGPMAGESRALAAVVRAYVSESHLEKAEEMSRARVAANLNDASAHDQLGQVYLQQGRDGDALVELTVASLLDPGRAATRAAIAQIQLGAEKYAEAVGAARRALSRDPRNRQARFALARALLQMGDERQAKTELAAAEQLQREELENVRQAFATNLIRIDAALREQQGRWDEASALRRDVTMRPEAAPSDFALLGDALSKAGRHAEAIDAFREALKRDSQPEVYRSLIREYRAAGRTAEADATQSAYQQVKRARFLESATAR